ncbi:hypothetical protein MB02_01460 [Croceicoccus estronivorus]|uniref:hypothetical protein n=1 Tax=Croceicoccus estronivorus TaxID=1172626 RepID=UPI00082C62A3|nr:hypothetical protein [Croceicoccus estronivorus]OCC25363.1 hypothetical protein MB02_01460 [Croceicoccus estronivorus]
MKFDMNRAWRDASEMVIANREVLLIVAGLFFFLPGLAAVLLIPSMQPPAEIKESEAIAFMTQFYTDNALWIILLAVVQTVGVLTLLGLLRGHAKPTVGDALKAGIVGILPYLGAQILFSLGVAAILGLLIGVAMATGLKLLIAVAAIATFILLVYALIKISLVPAVIAIERVTNPVTVLLRSWSLTKGNSFRLLLFYALLLIVFIVITAVIGAISGLLLALVGTGAASTIGEAIVSGLLGAIVTVYFVAILASIHRQLAGPSAEMIGRTFE